MKKLDLTHETIQEFFAQLLVASSLSQETQRHWNNILNEDSQIREFICDLVKVFRNEIPEDFH